MSDETLRVSFRSIQVFARVAPEHKHHIVDAFQKNGHVSAMTDDNFAPIDFMSIMNLSVLPEVQTASEEYR